MRSLLFNTYDIASKIVKLGKMLNLEVKEIK